MPAGGKGSRSETDGQGELRKLKNRQSLPVLKIGGVSIQEIHREIVVNLKIYSETGFGWLKRVLRHSGSFTIFPPQFSLHIVIQLEHNVASDFSSRGDLHNMSP